MVESLLDSLKAPQDLLFKSSHRQTGLCTHIPFDLFRIELTQIIQACDALASTVTLAPMQVVINSHLSAIANLEMIHGRSHCSMVYLNRQVLHSASLTKLCTGRLRNQDGGRASEYLKLLTTLFL